MSKIKNKNNQNEYYLTDLVKFAGDSHTLATVYISPEEALGVNSKEELERLEKILQK